VVGSEKGTEIEIRALVAERRSASEPVSVRVGIGTEQTAFLRDHFAATFVLEEQRLDGGGVEPVALPAAPVEIDRRPTSTAASCSRARCSSGSSACGA
jgi:hypothetical protein